MRLVNGHLMWIGNGGDLRDVRAILNAGIELADSEPMALLPRDLVRLRFPLSDGGENAPWLLRLATESVAALVRANVPVLVCCSAGMSRSICVAASAIALAQSRPLSESISLIVGSGPADVCPRLLCQFRDALEMKSLAPKQ